MGTVHVTLNYLGVPIESTFIDQILAGDEKAIGHPNYRILESFFELPLRHLPRPVLERYVEVTSRDNYTPFLPHDEKLFERILSPFRSAKRCFCLGEYIATIELCAHVAEMLAILLWEVTPIHHDGKPVTQEFEKALWGNEFEKLGQDRRVKVLAAFNAAGAEHVRIFDFLRTTRRDYFHLWSADVSGAKDDALSCFLKASQLIREILKMRISENDPGKIVINPLLSEYLNRMKS